VTYFDESTSTWTVTTAPGAYQAVCVDEHVLDWDGSVGARFAVLAPKDPVKNHALRPDAPNAGWRLYDPAADSWSNVPRQCEPEWNRHFSVATDYGLVGWEQATDEDSFGEGRLLVLPGSKPMP
jgi:hypothetical protein